MCGEREETVNHIISECSKLSQREYKTRLDLVGKLIHWELCKKFNFHHSTKWYMQKPESVLENETHKILWDFEVQTDHLIPARRPNLVLIDKKRKACHLVDSAVPADHRVKMKESEKYQQILETCQRTEKTVENEGEPRTNCNWGP